MGLNSPPEIYIFNRNRRTCYGAVKEYTEFEENIRFNSCSEITFKVANKYYDIDAEEWSPNQLYSHLVKNNLIFLDDTTPYFTYPVRTINHDYGIRTDIAPTSLGRNTGSMSYNDYDVTRGFKLQPETLLFNISVQDGYNWQNLTEPERITASTFTGGLIRYPDKWSTKFPYVGCQNFVPINPYDVIVTRKSIHKGDTGSDIRYFQYLAHFYTEADASTYVGSVDVTADAIKRLSINSLDSTYSELKKKMANGGFVRFTVTAGWNSQDYGDTTYASYYRVDNGVTTLAWSYPYYNWLQIYSGERYCKEVANKSREGTYDLPMHWFVIASVDEESDGISTTKTVTAYSYEYTLSARSISLSDGTFPLYIPPEIINYVNNGYWFIDKEVGGNFVYGNQKLEPGLLNAVIDLFPGWSVAHVSEELMTRYRSFGNVDNANIYSFLMNDVQSAYQCYFVFDNDNKTISAYTQDDIIQSSGVVLNWDNAIKHLQITDNDTAFVTALRGHTADDTYGLGLVNTTGNSTQYNFESLLDEMDFVADESTDDPEHRNEIFDGNDEFVRFRTLKEAVQELMDYLEHPNYVSPTWTSPIGEFTVNSLDDYRGIAIEFVKANLEFVKIQSKASELLAEYRATADKINVLLGDDFSDRTTYPYGVPDGYYIGDIPRRPSQMTHTNDYADYHSQALYYELYNAASNFYQIYDEIRGVNTVQDQGTGSPRFTAYGKRRIYQYTLSAIARRASLNYAWQVDLLAKYNNGQTHDEMNNPIKLPILTPNEILALQPFIFEGDWTNNNATFSETYSADDIISTLSGVYDQQKSDLDLFISKPMYDFETDEANWTEVEEMYPQAKRVRLGQTVSINTSDNYWVVPVLLEIHKNYLDKTDFQMTFTTDYNRKPLQFRFADLYSTITQTSVTDSAITFDE